MDNNYMKQFSTVVLGLFLLGMTNAFGQNITDNPANHQVTLGKALYEHGYNKDNLTSKDTPREDIDTVMVTSAMDYFVMPDAYYNKAYFQQADYRQTGLTSSQFVWTVTNGTETAQSANTATGTSPWVTITWGNTTGAATAKMKEVPQGLTAACEGEETTIPVFVIAKPTVGFTQVSSAYAAAGCYTDTNIANAGYDFPVSVTTSSSQVLVNCSVKWTKLDGTDGGVTTPTNIPVNSGVFNLTFGDYGTYEVTVTQITDRIARKCEMTGDINSGQNVFTYSALPQPKAGKTYHVPNNF